MVKRILIGIGIFVAVVLVAIAFYLFYVFSHTYRVDDYFDLKVYHTGTAAAEDPKTNTDYTILSYNIGFGAYSSDYSFFMDGGTESIARSPEAVRHNVDGAANEIKKANPDIALVQEVDVDGTRSHHIDEVSLLTKDLSKYSNTVYAQNYDSAFLAFPITQPHGANKAGIYTMSIFDIQSAIRRSLPIESGLTSFLDLDRCYSKSRIAVEGGHQLVVYNVHLSAYTTDGKIAETQLEMLFNDMKFEAANGNWCIAGGDFNKDLLGDSGKIFGVSGANYTWAQPIPANAIPSGVKVIAPYDPANPVPSCRNADRPYDSSTFRLTVDGFVVTDNVEVVSSKVIDTGFEYSDHNPVEMTFKLVK